MIGIAAITATAAINQVVNGVTVGLMIWGAVKYKRIPNVKVKQSSK